METISLRISNVTQSSCDCAYSTFTIRDGQNRFHRELLGGMSGATRYEPTEHTYLSAIFLTREDSICMTQCPRQNLLARIFPTEHDTPACFHARLKPLVSRSPFPLASIDFIALGFCIDVTQFDPIFKKLHVTSILLMRIIKKLIC